MEYIKESFINIVVLAEVEFIQAVFMAGVIGYSINMPFSAATIQISDNGGKTIKQFTLAQQQGAGSVTFDGGSVAAGSYTYSLMLDGKVYDTKTMVILKN